MDEWRRGWRIVLGCALGSGTGVVLLFFTFSLFILPLTEEFGGSRGDFGNIGSLIVAGALGAPVIGRLTDLFGFRRVFTATMLAVIAIELVIALMVDSLIGMAVGVFLLGLIGVGTTALTVTRVIGAWFDASRGLALGAAACGIAVATIVVPPGLEAVIAEYGWRMGFAALAVLAGCVGLPAVLLLVRNEPPDYEPAPKPVGESDWAFLKRGQFWLMASALIAMNMAGAGFVAQMSPMIQEEGLDAQAAAFALSAFAFGQFVGRLAGGWCLDRFNPRVVAVLLVLIPANGLLLLWGFSGLLAVALSAAFLIGFQQGADLDIFAFFTARKYGIANYGTVYGALQGLAWIGNAAGVIGVGQMHDAFGSYAGAQLAGTGLLVIGAALIAAVRLPRRTVSAP